MREHSTCFLLPFKHPENITNVLTPHSGGMQLLRRSHFAKRFNIIHRYAMSVRDLPVAVLQQERRWLLCMGDFAFLKEFFAQKKGIFWYTGRLFDALLRGFGQTVFSNNPLSGLLIIVTLAVIAPGTLALSATTAVLGLLVSVLIRESPDNVENGLTVLNPLLVGAISYVMIPRFYGAFDVFSLLHLLLATVISVYLARSLGSDKFSCTAWPFNLVEFALIFALSAQNGAGVVTRSVEPMFEMHNATSETTTTTTTTDNDGFYTRNATNIDWGMILRGSVVSASQLYGMDNVIVGSIMYLPMLIYSPMTAAFSFLGALGGTLIGLELGADHNEIYSGFWGYNSLLTGAALGGNLLVLNVHTAAATILAIIYTALLQFSIKRIFINTQLPVLTLPFVTVVTLFLKLSNGKEDPTFPWPVSISSPEKQRYDYLARCAAIREMLKRNLPLRPLVDKMALRAYQNHALPEGQKLISAILAAFEDSMDELEVVVQNEKKPTSSSN